MLRARAAARPSSPDRLLAAATAELVAHGGDQPLIAIHQLLNGADKNELPTIAYRPL